MLDDETEIHLKMKNLIPTILMFRFRLFLKHLCLPQLILPYICQTDLVLSLFECEPQQNILRLLDGSAILGYFLIKQLQVKVIQFNQV